MECKHCKSSWNSSLSVTNCPFCGKSIRTENNDNLNLSEGIATIVSEYGIEVLNNPKRLLALIMDYVRDFDKEKKLLKIACNNCGILKIAADIKTSPDNQRELLIKKAVKMLEDDVGFSMENAQDLVSLILTGLGVVYKPEKIEIQASQPQTDTTTQTIKTEVVSKPTVNNTPVSTGSTEERLKNIVLSNAASSQEDRDAICEIGRKKIMNRSFDEGFKYVQYAAKKGSMNGAILLGYCYDAGLGVKQDKKIAEAYYRQGAISNPEFISFNQHENDVGSDLFEVANKVAKRMLRATYVPVRVTAVEKKTETIHQISNNYFQTIKERVFENEIDKEDYIWKIVNENRRPTKEESGAILNLGRKLLKNGNPADGIKLIKYTAQYGYDYGALLLGYCYDKGVGVTKDYNIATAYYSRAGVSGGADASYKKYGCDDATHLSRARSVAEKIYRERI